MCLRSEIPVLARHFGRYENCPFRVNDSQVRLSFSRCGVCITDSVSRTALTNTKRQHC
jgi:hypothetical protein